MKKNPLINLKSLPPFSKVLPEHIEPALDAILSESRNELKNLLAQKSFTWENLMQPIEDVDDSLERMWSVVSHLNAVKNSDALRDAYQACLPKLSEYQTEMGQNVQLFEAVKAIHDSENFETLDFAQKKVLENALRDFKLSGVALPQDKKDEYKKLQQELSQLQTKFENNILDATKAWRFNTTNKQALKGLPMHVIERSQEAAKEAKEKGYSLELNPPTYIAVMENADNVELRKEVYTAYQTRASDQGPSAGKWDNTQVINDILAKRYERTKLLDFNNYAEYSLATKMVDNPKQVFDFIRDLVSKVKAKAAQEYEELKLFAKSRGCEDFQAWDVAYYSEKLMLKRYGLTQEQLRPYFPESKVLDGMFNLVKKIYGMSIVEEKDIDVWHESVRFFSIYDEDNKLRGQFYTDLYARKDKRGGAWMAECICRRRLNDGAIVTPVAFLNCNFSAPVGNKPGLLTHDDVQTLFHEFGHGLHHLLTQVDYSQVSGINGVPWDAVELPSQYNENWCWQYEVIQAISGHYQTGEPLPKEMFEQLVAARNYHSAMQLLRQMEFALFDFRLHYEFEPSTGAQVQKTLDEVRKEVAISIPPTFNRFQHGFSHIFAGGYAAGYYSYAWAEVLSSDVFSAFEENGLFDEDTGRKFLQTILAFGGSKEPQELFAEFRGREPKIDAFLRHRGITEEQ